MSTRAMYTFKDGHTTVHVYKPHDGYPEGAASWISNALPHAWPLPQFEADDFGAAFVAANKPSRQQIIDRLRLKLALGGLSQKECATLKADIEREQGYQASGMQGGYVRLVAGAGDEDRRRFACDIAYRYEITAKAGNLHVTAYETSCPYKPDADPGLASSWREKRIFSGSLAAMVKKFGAPFVETAV